MLIKLLQERFERPRSFGSRAFLKGAKRKVSRRTRRGLSLFETILTLFILVILISEGIKMLEAERSRIANRLEVDRVIELADLGERYVRQDMIGLLAGLRTLPGYRRLLDADDLVSAGLVMADAVTLLSPLRREVELWLHAPGGGSEIMVLARAHGDVTRVNIPGSAASTGPIGWVSSVEPTRLRGIGLDWDVSTYQAAWGWPAPNDLVALRYLNFDADIRPYLHRSDISMNGVDLNEMAADLDMGGHSIDGIDELSAQSIDALHVNAQSVSVTGTLQADEMTIEDYLFIEGPFWSGDANFTGDIVLGSAEVVNSLTAGSVSVSGAVDAASAQISGLLSAGTATITGDVTGQNAALGGESTASSLNVGSLAANEAAIVGTITGTTGFIQHITTGSCAGC